MLKVRLTNVGGGVGCFAILFLYILPIVCWIVNVSKLVQCIINAPEPFVWDRYMTIHAVGLLPYVSIVTAWF